MKGRTHPLVSVVINNYNYGRFLAECVDSALAQTYTATEVIVIDDGSTDDSRSILERYRGRANVVFKKNGGQASSLNIGFASAQGEIVFFLDSDDKLYPSTVERVAKAWTADVAKAHFRLDLIDEEGRDLDGQVPTTMHSGDVTTVIAKFGTYGSPPSSGNAYSRAALNRWFPIPESEFGRYAADTYPIVLAPFCGRVISLQTSGGAYRLHKGRAGRTITSNNMTSASDLTRRRENARQIVLRKLKDAGYLSWAPLYAPAIERVRATSWRLDEQNSPLKNESRRAVLYGAIQSVWQWPGFTLFGRITYSAWFLVVMFAPRAVAQWVIELGETSRFRLRSGLGVSLRSPPKS